MTASAVQPSLGSWAQTHLVSILQRPPPPIPSNPPMFPQVLRSVSVPRIQPFLNPQRDVILSIEQMRHRLLALSCIAPGASTLVANLLRATCHEPPAKDAGAGGSVAGRRWLREYAGEGLWRLREEGLHGQGGSREGWG